MDGSYKVLTLSKFNKSIKKNLPRQLKGVLDRKIKYLAENPHHPSLNTKALRVSIQKCAQLGVDKVWEFYINRDFRCIFYERSSDKEIILIMVGNHENVGRRFPH